MAKSFVYRHLISTLKLFHFLAFTANVLYNIHMITKNCGVCGSLFDSQPCHKRIYCSDLCGRSARRGCRYGNRATRIVVTCQSCKKDFEILSSALKRSGRAKFCSKKCYWSAKIGRPISSRREITYFAGYTYVKDENGRRVGEHRHVMEKLLGRRLLRSEHVHHKDHNRSNNSLENLELLTASEHMKRHAAERTPKERSEFSRMGRAALTAKTGVPGVIRKKIPTP